jgi:hypothetical protein
VEGRKCGPKKTEEDGEETDEYQILGKKTKRPKRQFQLGRLTTVSGRR